MTDEMIIDLYWARSESAISETAKKFGGYCFAIASNIVQNSEDAEECVNDAYHKAWQAIPPQRPLNLRLFLGKIIRNLSLNRYNERKAKRRGGDEMTLLLSELEDCIPSGSTVEAEYESSRIAEAINACLRSIDSVKRIVFVRRYWYADSVKAIAGHFNMSESKVTSMLHRTRKALKAHLEQEGVTL